MAKLTISIDMNNAAFEDDRRAELSRILFNYAYDLEQGANYTRKLKDINGNKVGETNLDED